MQAHVTHFVSKRFWLSKQLKIVWRVAKTRNIKLKENANLMRIFYCPATDFDIKESKVLCPIVIVTKAIIN